MNVEASFINDKGKPLYPQDRKAVRGALSITEERDVKLGRTIRVASLMCVVNPELMKAHDLHDAEVLFLQAGRLRIRGFEVVDGVQYGQTWDCRVVA